MKIYVASKFENKVEVRRVQAMLRAAGHEITWDWTSCDSSKITDPAQRVAYHAQCAMDDMRGVVLADALLLLGHPGMKGALIEVGMAIAAGVRVLVVDRQHGETVFFDIGDHMVLHFEHVEDALSWCSAWQKRPAA